MEAYGTGDSPHIQMAFIRIISTVLSDSVIREGVVIFCVGWMMVIVPLQHHASDIWTSFLGYNSTLPILHFIGQHRPKYVPTGLHYSEGLISIPVSELPIRVISGRMPSEK